MPFSVHLRLNSSVFFASDIPHSLKLRELQTRPHAHLPARDAAKDQNKLQILAPTPSSLSSEQGKTYTNSHPLMEETPAKDLPAAGGANSGRFGAR